MHEQHNEPYILTHSGRRIVYDSFSQEDVCIEDIAHALSNVCRFGGHTTHHYSVATHSLLVCDLAPQEFKLAALLHDGAEAYISDIVTPAKRHLPDYLKLEARIERAIESKFGIKLQAPAVKHADIQALCIEATYFFGEEEIKDWGFSEETIGAAEAYDELHIFSEKLDPFVIKQLFLCRYKHYREQK